MTRAHAMAPPRSRGVIALAVLALLCGAARGSPVRKLLQGDIAGDSLPNKRVANDDVHGDDHKNNFNPVDNSGAAQLFIRKESDLPGGDFDLQYSSIVFQAGGGACRAPASQLAVDPTGGALLELNSDDTTEIEFDDGFEFPFFGKNYDSAFVASNGFVTFGEDDDEFRPTMDRHFDGPPRISGLWTDLATGLNGTYSWKQVNAEAGPWSAVAVTFHDLISTDHKAVRNTFQIAMMANGDVLLSFLDANPHHDALVGIAPGRTGESSADASSSSSFPPWDNGKWEQAEDEEAGPPSYQQTNLSNLPACGLGTAAVLGMWANRGTDEVAAPGGEAEIFLADEDRTSTFDLAFTTLTFPADGGPPCATDVSTHGVDPTGGRVLRLPDDGNEEVAFEGDFAFPFFGQRYSSMFVSSNGYVTFGEGDWLHSVTELEEHYTHPRVAALFSDLNPPEGSVSVKQLADEAVAVTYAGVPSFASEDAVSNFQITLFASGEVQLSYLEVQPLGATVVGLSAGRLPPDVTSVDLLASGGECEAPPATVSPDVLAASLNVDAVPGYLTLVAYQRNVTFPLANRSLRFAAGGAGSCSAPSAAFPVDPAGGDTVDLIDDNSVEVAFEDGFVFPFFGQEYPSVWVGSNGYLTFGASDTTSFPDLENHYALPRVAALFTDLDPSDGGRVSVKQTADAVAVTYRNIKAYGGQGGGTNTFQVVLSASGEVTVVYKDLDPKRDAIVGLSSGDMPRYPITISTLDDSQPCPAEEAP
mmetsp:Transcript_43899/g.113668  ORF Transcript_43899/g.113668 Transcript_43899/m.113668 type:complete len:757 (-) Transcript_43899:159-2429(-)